MTFIFFGLCCWVGAVGDVGAVGAVGLTNGPASEKMLSSGDTRSGDTAFWVNFERAIMCGERIRSIWSEAS